MIDRLVDDSETPAELREMLEAARVDSPSAAATARMTERLDALAAGGSGAAATAGGFKLGWLIAGLVVAIATVAAIVAFFSIDGQPLGLGRAPAIATGAEAVRAVRRPVPKPSEIDLVEAARDALARGDHRAALGAVRRHLRDYPRGVLVEEREAIAVEALIGLGRAAAARDRLERFTRQFPASSYRQRLRALID